MKRSEAARAKWARVIEAQALSGLSAAEFCRRRRIWASSFFSWKRRLKGTGSPASPQPVFVEAKVCGVDAGGGGGVMIEIVGGRRVVALRGFDRQLLLDVIEALESSAEADA